MKTLLILLLSAATCFAQPLLVTDPAFLSQQVTATAVTANTLTNGLVAYYRLDNSASWVDELGAHNLTAAGSVTNGVGIITNSAGMDGAVTTVLSATDHNDFSALDNSLTLVGWAKFTATNQPNQLISKVESTAAGNAEYAIGYSKASSVFYFLVYTNGSTSTQINDSTAGTPLNSWVFLVGKIDVTNKQHSFRVGRSTLGAWTTSAEWGGWGYAGHGTNTTRKFGIGRRDDQVFNSILGFMDEVGVWNRTLTDTEITNLWNSGSGKTYPFQ